MSSSPFELFRRNLKPLMVLLTLLALISFVILPSVAMYQQRNAGMAGSETRLASYDGGNFDAAKVGYFTRAHYMMVQSLAQLAEITISKGGTPRVANFQYNEQAKQIANLGINSQPSDATSVRTMMFAAEAKKAGLDLDDTAIQSWLAAFTDGRLSDAEINGVLADATRNQMGQFQLYEQVRTHLLSEAFQRQAMSGLAVNNRPIVTPAQQWELFLRLNRQAKADAFAVPVADFVAQTSDKPPATEINRVYQEGKDRFPDEQSSLPAFRRPYTANFEILTGSLEEFIQRELPNFSEEQLRQEYQRRLDGGDFKMPELPPEEPAPAEPGDKPAEPADKPAEPGDKPADPPAEKPADPPADKPAEPADKPAEPAEKPADAPADKPAEPAEKPADAPADKPVEPAEKPAEPADKPADEPAPKPEENGAIAPKAVLLVAAKAQEAADPAKPDAPAEKPADAPAEKPADAPAAEKPADAPAAEKPADAPAEKPADAPAEKPADAPAEKPADAPAEKPADAPAEKPADAAAEKPAETPAPKLRPFEDVRDEVARSLALPPAREKLDRAITEVDKVMRSYFNAKAIAGNDPAKQPARPDLKKLAEGVGMTHSETGLRDARQVQDLPIARSFGLGSGMQRGNGFLQTMYIDQPPAFSPLRTVDDQAGASFVSWKTEEKAASIPTLAEATDEVIAAIRFAEARKLAKAYAEKMAAEFNKSDKPVAELVTENQKPLLFEKLGPFSWMNSFGFGMQAFIGNVPQLDNVGEDFMRAVFTGEPNRWGVAPNMSESVYYAVRPTEFSPSTEELHSRFTQLIQRLQASSLAVEEVVKIRDGYYEALDKKTGFKWNETALEDQK
jgi:hypothetical protein